MAHLGETDERCNVPVTVHRLLCWGGSDHCHCVSNTELVWLGVVMPTTRKNNPDVPETLGPALLSRLEHVLGVRQRCYKESNIKGQKLIQRSVWIAFEDCHTVGLRREALLLLDSSRHV